MKIKKLSDLDKMSEEDLLSFESWVTKSNLAQKKELVGNRPGFKHLALMFRGYAGNLRAQKYCKRIGDKLGADMYKLMVAKVKSGVPSDLR